MPEHLAPFSADLADKEGAHGVARPMLRGSSTRSLTMCARHLSIAVAARSGSPAVARHEPRGARAQYDEFISLASHELMTPVTALRLQAQHMRRLLAQHPEEAPTRIPSMVETFDRQLGRLSLLCDELLQATRIAADELPLVCEEVDLGSLASAIVERVAPRPDLRSLITIDISGAPRGHWDRMLVEQLVLHLVRNALVYGEGKPVSIDVSQADGWARLVVRDRGMGIADEDQARIFERFERAVPLDRFGGLGLGLYIARAVANAHGGSIRVESAPGQGSTFIVELPFAPTAPRRALEPMIYGASAVGRNRPVHHRRCRRPGARVLAARRPRCRASNP
ncbi:sensor histidine kinase [Polyangium aurulentum]|uniref:sensor histidine kinase n=1 Tax=Polyangium aurulentum TaxID=2567896 RepID=UPI0010ADA989|nr:HAMP domain-containing sensor histidine kinase [Polyangium aurulentum]UQA60620.1 HAMP domain-containing histidine kinase [Polyangium aurulentum]